MSRSPLPTFPQEMGSRVTSPPSQRPRRQGPGLQYFSPLGELQDSALLSFPRPQALTVCDV